MEVKFRPLEKTTDICQERLLDEAKTGLLKA